MPGSSGILKLRVVRCGSTVAISDADISVELFRPGVGVIDSGSGTTDGQGHVQIPFEGLEGDDEARTTVTPKGESPDSDHTYYWVAPDDRSSGYWDFSSGDSLCEDDWYDQQNNVIQCVYDSNR